MIPPLILDLSFKELGQMLFRSQRNQGKSASFNLTTENQSADVFFCVRSAWDLFLSAQKFPPDSEILMSGINIPHMKEIVEAHGLVARIVDIQTHTLLPDLQDIKSSLSPRTVGVLCAHLFGTWSPLTELAEWCRNNGLFLIEDCAQSFMGHDFTGTTSATATFFSFGTIKRSTVLGGAVGIIRDQELRTQMLKIETNYPRQKHSMLRKKALKTFLLKLLTQPLAYSVVVRLLRSLRGGHEDFIRNSVRGFPAAQVPFVFRMRPSRKLSGLVQHTWNKTSSSLWKERMNKILSAAESAGIPKEHIPGNASQLTTFWLFPLLSADPQRIVDHLRVEGFDATRGLSSMKDLSENPDSMAGKILSSLVFLPVSQQQIPHLHKMTRMLGYTKPTQQKN
ncbi:MAG: hypothetical protein RI953_2603 [Pseudomonadota bacterium]|jgi:dTDP-4-amino-4,6-dideoxygalactose transaminase